MNFYRMTEGSGFAPRNQRGKICEKIGESSRCDTMLRFTLAFEEARGKIHQRDKFPTRILPARRTGLRYFSSPGGGILASSD